MRVAVRRRLNALVAPPRSETPLQRLCVAAGVRCDALPLRALFVLGAGAAGGAVLSGVPGALAGVPAAALGTFFVLLRRAAARLDRIEHAFPFAVRAMCDTVRAGGNVQQALTRAHAEASPPMRDEIGRVLDELRVGVRIEDALAEFARRNRIRGADVLAVALTSAVRSGADVRPVLECIVDAAVDRRRLSRELRAATAQGRMTALVIGVLPVAFLMIMGAGGGGELRFLFHEPAGIALVAAGVLLEAAGFAWMRRIGRPRPR